MDEVTELEFLRGEVPRLYRMLRKAERKAEDRGRALRDAELRAEEQAIKWANDVERLQKYNETLRAALGNDQADRPFADLLRQVAELLGHNSGPVWDCVRAKAVEVEEAVAWEVPEPTSPRQAFRELLPLHARVRADLMRALDSVAELRQYALDGSIAPLDVIVRAETAMQGVVPPSEDEVFVPLATVQLFTRWPTVLRFAERMMRKLDQHKAAKGGREGWIRDRSKRLLERAREELKELEEELSKAKMSSIVDEAADVANMVMMVADASGALYGPEDES